MIIAVDEDEIYDKENLYQTSPKKKERKITKHVKECLVLEVKGLDVENKAPSNCNDKLNNAIELQDGQYFNRSVSSLDSSEEEDESINGNVGTQKEIKTESIDIEEDFEEYFKSKLSVTYDSSSNLSLSRATSSDDLNSASDTIKNVWTRFDAVLKFEDDEPVQNFTNKLDEGEHVSMDDDEYGMITSSANNTLVKDNFSDEAIQFDTRDVDMNDKNEGINDSKLCIDSNVKNDVDDLEDESPSTNENRPIKEQMFKFKVQEDCNNSENGISIIWIGNENSQSANLNSVLHLNAESTPIFEFVSGSNLSDEFIDFDKRDDDIDIKDEGIHDSELCDDRNDKTYVYDLGDFHTHQGRIIDILSISECENSSLDLTNQPESVVESECHSDSEFESDSDSDSISSFDSNSDSDSESDQESASESGSRFDLGSGVNMKHSSTDSDDDSSVDDSASYTESGTSQLESYDEFYGTSSSSWSTDMISCNDKTDGWNRNLTTKVKGVKPVSTYVKAVEVKYKRRLEKMLRGKHRLACEAFAMKDFKFACEKFKVIVDELVREFGPNHERVGSAYHNLSIVYLTAGKVETAVDYIEEAVSIRKSTLGKYHPWVTESLIEKGKALLEMEDYIESITCLQEALGNTQLYRPNQTPSHELEIKLKLQRIVILNNLGCAYFKHDVVEFSIEAFQKANEILGEIHNGDDVYEEKEMLFVTASFNLAYAFIYEGKWEDAASNLEKGLQTMGNIFPPNHPHVMRVEECLAYVNVKLGRYNSAIIIYKRLLRKEQELCSEDDIRYTDTMMYIVYNLLQRDMYTDAMTMLQSIKVIQTNQLGPSSAKVRRTQELITSLEDLPSNKYGLLIGYIISNIHIAMGKDDKSEMTLKSCMPRRPDLDVILYRSNISYA